MNMQHQVSTKDEIESKFSTFQKYSFFLAILLIFVTSYSIYALFRKEFQLSDDVVPIYYFAFSFFVLWKNLKPFYGIIKSESIKAELADQELLGTIDKNQFLAMIEEVLAPIRNQKLEIPKIFIKKTSEINACSINSLIFNFLDRINGIYLNEGLITTMNLAEIRSVLAHELAHFIRYTPLFMRISFIICLFLAFFPIFIFVQIFDPSYSLFGIFKFFFISYIFYIICNILVNYLINHNGRLMEYLSDYYAAKNFGKLNMINALLVLGKTAELQETIIKQIIRKLKSDVYMPVDHFKNIFDFICGKLGNDLYIDKKQIKKRVDQLWRSDEIIKLKSPIKLSREEKKNKNQQLKAVSNHFYKEYKLHDWSKFDIHVVDNKIDDVEYPIFIKELKKKPDRQLFETIEDNLTKTRRASHPNVTKRILFIAKNLP